MRLAILTLVLGLPVPVLSQQPVVMHLAPENASLAASFTRISAVRELRDGRVLILDPRDQGLVVANMGSGAVEPISRKGGGPGEYQSLRYALPLAGDSTLLPAGPGRWLLMDGARVVVTVPPDDSALRASGGSPASADMHGHVLGMGAPSFHAGTYSMGKGDSLAVLLVSRATGAGETVARTRVAPMRVTVRTGKDGQITSMELRRPVLAPGEAATLFPDGWIAVARLDPYRVDWRAPDGSWTKGAAIPVPVVRLDDREKRAEMQRIADETGRPVPAPETVEAWPETMPPFVDANALYAAPDGRLVVLRQPTAEAPGNRYDVVDRRGRVAGTLSLPANQRIVGFGAKSVYIAFTDDDGLQTLRRHPWPSATP